MKKKINIINPNAHNFFYFFLQKRVRFLQSQGAKEDNNPEYAQIMNFLKNLQKQQQSRPNVNTTEHLPSIVTSVPPALPSAGNLIHANVFF